MRTKANGIFHLSSCACHNITSTFIANRYVFFCKTPEEKQKWLDAFLFERHKVAEDQRLNILRLGAVASAPTDSLTYWNHSYDACHFCELFGNLRRFIVSLCWHLPFMLFAVDNEYMRRSWGLQLLNNHSYFYQLLNPFANFPLFRAQCQGIAQIRVFRQEHKVVYA